MASTSGLANCRGGLVLPVGSLNQTQRVTALQEDIFPQQLYGFQSAHPGDGCCGPGRGKHGFSTLHLGLGRSHIIHYDFLFHTKPREAKMRPFIAVGAGIKVFQGIGVERAFQPLSQFVLLTKEDQTLGLISVGGGVKWAYGNHLSVRVEVRDYITPAPKEVLVPSPGASISGWLHDILPLAGLSYRF